MSRFLRFLTVLSAVFFTTNLFAASYSCPTSNKKYTSCNAGYYLTSSSYGNSCASCSSAKNTTSTRSGTESCSKSCSIANGTCTYSNCTQSYTDTCSGYYTGGGGGTTVGSSKCTGCSAYSRTSTGTCGSCTISITCNTGYTQSGNTCVPKEYSCVSGNYLNGTTCSPCEPGYYCKGGTWTYNGGIQGRNSCSTDTNSGYPNSAAGSSSSAYCYLTTSSTKYVAETGKGQVTCAAGGYCPGGTTVYYTSGVGSTTGGRTACSAGTKNASTGSSSSSACTACAAGTYNTTTGNTSCSTCPAGSYCTGGSNKTACPSPYSSSGAGSSSSAYCYLTTSSTKYVAETGKGQVTCAAGGYCPGGTTVYYTSGIGSTTGGRTACSAGKKNASTGSSSSSACTACAAGTYNTTTGNTSCSTCPAGSYCTGGSNKTACPSPYSSSGAGSSSNAYCYLTTSSTKYVAETGKGQVTCAAGGYCPGGTTVYYTSGIGSTTGGRTACSAGTKNASTGSSSSSACTACAAGTYNTTTGNTSCSTCPAGSYCTGGSNKTACPSPYSSSGVGSSSSAYCYLTTSSTKYVAETGKGQVTCAAGGYCPGGTTVYYTSGVGSTTGGRTACSAGTKNASTGSSSSSACTACAAGTYSTGGASACSTVSDGCYGGASATTACPNTCSGLNSFYTKSDSGRDASTDCYGTTTSGNYIATAKSGQVTCAAGGYCPGSVNVYYNSTGGRTACSAGTKNASTGSSSSSACTACAAGTYSTGGASACSAVNEGCFADATGSTSACPKSCSSLNSFYTKSDSGRDASTDCYGTTTSGNYIATAKSGQVTCAAGGYCPGSVKVYYNSTGGRTACSAGTKNASTGSSSSSACTTCAAGTYNTTTGNTSCSTCPAGSYCTGGSNKTACGGGKYSSDGATSCSSISAGCYGTSASSSCPAVCGENQYSTAGSSSCSSCPTDYKNSGTSASSHAGSASCIITVSAGKYIGTAGDNSSNWDTCACGTYKPSHTVAYGSTSSCAKTDTGYYAEAGAGSQTKATAGYYAAAGACSQTACSGRTKYSAAGAGSCSTVSTGYYTTGCNSSGNACTAQTICAKGTYCSSGVSNNCPGGTYGSTTGLSSSSCSGTCTAGYYCPAGSTSATQNACGAGKYSSAGSDAAADCGTINAGCYGTSASSSCPAVCGENQYSTAGSSSCSSCPTDYKNSGTSASSHAGSASCIITVSAGKYIGTAGDNSTNWDTCAGGTYKASHTVAYGSTSSCSTCSAGYYCPAGAGSQTACAVGSYSAAGKSVCTACGAGKTTSGTGKDSCDATCGNASGVYSWATPSWSANSVSNLCKVTACNANTYYTATTATGYANTCSACGANSSTSAGNTSTTCACSAGYTADGKVGGTATTTSAACQLISNIACAIGQYVPAKATACSDCTAGYYCPSSAKTYSYSTSVQGRTACSPGTYQPSTGKTSCVDASAGYYVGGSAATSQTACTGATYAANTKQSSCTPCPAATNNTSDVVSYAYWNTNGKAGDQTTRAGCNATFKAKTLDDGTMSSYSCYVDSGADTYGVDGTSKTCWVVRSALKCNGGYYNATFNNSSTATQYTSNKTLTDLFANVCTNAGAGYWSADDSLTRTACATGLTTIGYGTAANEAEDCGRKLHYGSSTVYLRGAARTTPSLRVKIGDTTFFGALSTTRTGALKVNNGGTKYSVVNDWQ